MGSKKWSHLGAALDTTLKMWSQLVSSLLLCFFTSISHGGRYRKYPSYRRRARAVVDLVSGGDSGVTGRLHVVQGYGAVHIGGEIDGLKPGLHGFHVHMTGDIGDNCKAAGGHFNPDGVKLKTSLSQNT